MSFIILEGILFDHPSHDEMLKDVGRLARKIYWFEIDASS